MTKFATLRTQFTDYVRHSRKGRGMPIPGLGMTVPPRLHPTRYYELMLPATEYMLGSKIEREATYIPNAKLTVEGGLDGVAPDQPTRSLKATGDATPRRVPVTTVGSTWLQMCLEDQWYALGQPEYKVHPGMVDALAHTRLELPGNAVNLPFPCFAVRLPHHYLREREGAPWVEALLVSEVIEHQLGHDRRKLVVVSAFEEDPDADDPMANHILTKFELDADLTVQAALDAMPFPSHVDGLYWPDAEMTRELVALAISTALIAIGNDRKLILPTRESTSDRLRRKRTEKRHGVGSGGSRHGFEVGADIRLPKPKDRPSSTKGEPTGRRLDYGHIRSGHIRLARCKDEDGETVYRPIFIRPTIVRPDLPLKPKATPHALAPLPEEGVA